MSALECAPQEGPREGGVEPGTRERRSGTSSPRTGEKGMRSAGFKASVEKSSGELYTLVTEKVENLDKKKKRKIFLTL